MIPLVAPKYSNEDREIGAVWDDPFHVRRFEEEFAVFVGCRGAVAVNSGTNALKVALHALGRTDRVSIQSFTCRATLDAAVSVCKKVSLVDNECDIGRARFGPVEMLTVNTHMFGTVGTIGCYVEDITLSLGAPVKPSVAAVCSFNRDKMISTGRGGIITGMDEDFLARCRELAYYDQPLLSGPNGHGAQGDPATATTARLLKQPSAQTTTSYRPAFSFGMTGMQAALGRSQLAQLPSFIERRRHVAAQYTEAFTEAGIECPDPDVDSVFFRYIIGVDDPADKVGKLAGRGIEAGRGVNPPLHRLLDLDPAAFPGAEECWSKLLSVPVHPGLTDEQVGYITEQVIEVCGP